MDQSDVNDFSAMADAIAGMDTFSTNFVTRIAGALHATAGIGILIPGAPLPDQITIHSHMRELADVAKLVAKVRKYTSRIINAFPQRNSFWHLVTFIEAHQKFFTGTAALVQRITSFRASLYVQGSFFYSGTLTDGSMRSLDLYISRFNERYSAMTVALRNQRGRTHVRW